MSHISMCRICLCTDARMHMIANTPLQDLYEKLTNLSLCATMRPLVVCYLCYSQMKKCHMLMKRSIKADELLTKTLQTNTELNENSITIADRITYNLVNTLTIWRHSHIITTLEPETYLTVKDEITKPYEDSIEKIEVKDEGLQEYTKLDAVESDAGDKNTPSSDSEDDIPLKNISMKRGVNDMIRNKNMKKVSRINAREIILTKEEQLQEMMARAKSINYLNSPFKCGLCYKGFVDLRAYNNHKEKHDEKSGPFVCDICSMRYRTARHLRTHLVTCHHRQYQCNQCSHRSHTANQARDHDKWHNGHTYECQLCSQKFRKPTSYLTHMRKRHPTEHVCNMCGECFVGRHGLLMHKTKTHRGNEHIPQENDESVSKRFCADCNIQFATIEAWQRHIISSVKHLVAYENSSQCRICGERVTDSLSSHLREHERSLRTPRVLASKDKLFQLPCDQCGSNFVSRAKLQAHIKRIHLGVKYNKNVVCEVCGKKCISNAALRYHQRTHTGEKPYTCGSCSKRFPDKNQLRIHTRIHTGEKPYCCAVCEKRFTQKPALNRHYRVHTGAKPYECQFCSKTFSQSNSLKLHVKTVHLKLPLNKKNQKCIEESVKDKIHTSVL